MGSINRQHAIAALGLLLMIWTWAMFREPLREAARPLTDTITGHARPQEAPIPGTGSSSPSSSKKQQEQQSTTPSNPNSRPLVLYAYAESQNARQNIDFFIKKGLHAAADFIFIFNGETDAYKMVPKADNIKVVQRENTCYDLGAYGEVLRGDGGLYKRYKRFIMMNASLRGPFSPYWSDACWSDKYLERVTDKVKLVGMTANCTPRFHVQSMIWATDDVGIKLLLEPPAGSGVDTYFGKASDPIGLKGCYDSWEHAVHSEIASTHIILNQGYKVDVMMEAFHKSPKYIEECVSEGDGDMLKNDHYFGSNIHPYETIFMKTNRDIDPELISHLTEWHLAEEGTSYAVCGR